MKNILKLVFVLFIGSFLLSCLTPPAPTELEFVSWEELADQSMMVENDNRYVSFQLQFIGMDALALPSQMIYGDIANVILVNHIDLDGDYNDGVTTSLDSFLVGLPMDNAAEDFMTTTDFGKTVDIIGRTEFVNAGFGLFKHLLVRVESYEIVE